MLQVMRRGRTEELRPLVIEEDRALRRAFGRFAAEAARPAGARVVREHQAARGGQWFACDCQGGAVPAPVLVPVSETHVRRHVEPPWPEHSEWCDFYREAEQQRAVSASFRRPAPGGRLRLVRSFGAAEALERVIVRASSERGRSGLAMLLLRLLDEAGLTRAQPGHVRSIAEQFGAIRKAASVVEVDEDQPLSKVLCTFPPALPEFVDKISRLPPDRFRKSRRPHGLLLGVATDAGRGRIVPAQGEPFEVRGAISIFGEADGHAAGRRLTVGERSPYVMACVVGRRHPDEAVEVLRAYLHPCATPTWVLPVDSNYERVTLKRLLSLGHWMASKHSRELSIEKPVFDLAPPVLPQTPGALVDPHEPIIPDFIVSAADRRIVVETMGFDLPAYRDRKARMHGEMSRLCGGASVVEHDFCRPADWTQEDRDRRFGRDCRSALLGPTD